MALMQLRDVAVSGRLEPFSASVKPGELLHLVGPNGAGKSTLLSRMAGITSGAGSIDFVDEPLSAWRSERLARHRAYLAQQQMPPFAMPVWHYLALHQHASPNEKRMTDVAASLWLGDKLTRPVNQLSGGEWQRVRLAAVVLQIDPQTNPHGKLLLLDEPMNSLDVAQQAALDKVIYQLCEAGVTVVTSSHDLNHTLRHAHRVWLLRNGKLIAEGKRDDVLTPALLGAAYGLPFRRLQVEGHSMLICPL